MDELDLKEVFQVFWTKKIQILIIIVVSLLIGGIYTYNYVTPIYKASTTLILGRINSSEDNNDLPNNNQDKEITQSDISINSSLVSTYSELIKSESLIKEVKSNLNIEMSELELRKSISVSRVSDTELIEITVVNKDSKIVSEVANEIAKVFGNKVEEIYKISNVYIIDKAIPQTSPYNINHVKDFIIFGFIGIFISAIYVLLYYFLDTTIKSTNDIEKTTNLKNLISIPYIKSNKAELITYQDSKSIVSEAFRTLRTNVQFSSINEKKSKTILVTSCFQSEGKSYISANLAITFAQAGKKVILIDSDMRRGRQAKIFNFPNEIGLSNYISNIDVNGIEINYDITKYIKETGITNLNIITSGNIPPNPSELLTSPKVPELIRQLQEFYDIIIFDGAPVLPITDSLILTRLIDSTILVARYNKTKKNDMAKAKLNLENVGGKIIGTCLNAVNINSNFGDLNYYYSEKSKITIKDRIKQCFKNIKQCIKKLRKLKKINKNRKIKIIEEVNNIQVKHDLISNNSEISSNTEDNNIIVDESKEKHEVDLRKHKEKKKKKERIEAELRKQEEEKREKERIEAELRKQEEEKREKERIEAELRKQEEEKREKERIEAELRKQEEEKREKERIEAELRKQEEERKEQERLEAELRKQEEEKREKEKIETELKNQEKGKELVVVESKSNKKKKLKKLNVTKLKRKNDLTNTEKNLDKKRYEKEIRIKERKQKIATKFAKFKEKAENIKTKIEKNKEEKQIKKAEKKIKVMEEQAKHIKQKNEENKSKMFGKKMFDFEEDDFEDNLSNEKR